MIRIFLPLICAALGLVAASCSQSGAPLAPTEAPASPQPTSHGAASAAMARSPDKAPTPGAPPAAGAASTDGAPPVDGTEQLQQAPAAEQVSTPPASAAPATPASVSPSPAPQAAPAASPDVSMPAERRASTLIGMPVASADGNPLGQVKDIVFDRQGRATHLVIAYGMQPEIGPGEIPDDGKPTSAPDGKLTAMPWDAALASIKDGRLVLDATKLQSAPSFTADAWPNLDDPSWSAPGDAYWRKVVQADIAAHPGSPIDSMTRQRGRPARDGDGNGNDP